MFTMSVWLTAVDTGWGHLVKVVPFCFLYFKVTVLPLLLKYILEKELWDYVHNVNILFQFKLLLANCSVHWCFVWNKNEVFPKCWIIFFLFPSFLPMRSLEFCKDWVSSAPFIYFNQLFMSYGLMGMYSVGRGPILSLFTAQTVLLRWLRTPPAWLLCSFKKLPSFFKAFLHFLVLHRVSGSFCVFSAPALESTTSLVSPGSLY